MAKLLTETRKGFQKHVLRVLSRDDPINFADLDGSESDTILLAKWETILGLIRADPALVKPIEKLQKNP